MRMDQRELSTLLSNTPLLQGLSALDLDRLTPSAQVITANSRDWIVTEGQAGAYLFIVLQGHLRVMLPSNGSKRRWSSVQLNTLTQYDCFGEYALLDAQPASASVIALTPARLLQLPKTQFENWLAGDDRIAATVYRNLLQLLIQRLRRKDLEIDIDVTPVTTSAGMRN